MPVSFQKMIEESVLSCFILLLTRVVDIPTLPVYIYLTLSYLVSRRKQTNVCMRLHHEHIVLRSIHTKERKEDVGNGVVAVWFCDCTVSI